MSCVPPWNRNAKRTMCSLLPLMFCIGWRTKGCFHGLLAPAHPPLHPRLSCGMNILLSQEKQTSLIQSRTADIVDYTVTITHRL